MLRVVLLCFLIGGAFSHPKPEEIQYDNDHKHPRINYLRSNIRAEEEDASFWNDMAQATLAEHLSRNQNTNQAKNIILFMGDGLSIPTLTATRIFQGGEQHKMVFEQFPHVGLSKTYCVDAQVPDSACTSTAYLGGVKANTATAGVTAAVLNKDCNAMMNTSNHVNSILWKAQQAGKSTGIVTTTRITHASPSGAYAHIAERDWESDTDMGYDGVDDIICDDIAEQLIRGETGRNLKVVLAGGRGNFRPKTQFDEEGLAGRRTGPIDLIAEWQQRKETSGETWRWAWDRTSLEAIDIANTDYVMGLFESSHLQYHVYNDETLKPSLVELVTTAIASLSRDPNGYVLFVEGGRIDSAHHETRAQIAFDETIQFDEAIRAALELTDPQDTLIVTTSDHSHTMSISGYAERGAGVLGHAGISDMDGLPYATITYSNGEGYKTPLSDGSRYDISNDNMEEVSYQFPSTAPKESENHGGDDVAVFARGPWSHLFTGTYEQNFIHHAMCYSACLGDGLTACSAKN